MGADEQHPGTTDDIASLIVRPGIQAWPWPFPWRSFRNEEPPIVELIARSATPGQPGQAELVRAMVNGNGPATVIRNTGSESTNSGVGLAPPLVSQLQVVREKLYGRDAVARFRRLDLVASLSELDCAPSKGEPGVMKSDSGVILMDKLHKMRKTRDDNAALSIFIKNTADWPFPFKFLSGVVEFVASPEFRFWIWFWGIAWFGREWRWLRRQWKRLRPDEPFKNFLLSLVARTSESLTADEAEKAERLAAQAFLEDLRIVCQPRLWRRRTRNRWYRPVLVLDHLDDEFPKLLAEARKQTRENGGKPDPLLIVLVRDAERGESESALHPQVVHQIGDPPKATDQRFNRLWLARLAWVAVPPGVLVIPAAALLFALHLLPGASSGVPGPVNHGPRTAVPSPVALHRQEPPPSSSHVLSPSSRCQVQGDVPPSEAKVAEFDNGQSNVRGKDVECVGYSSTDSAIFLNQQGGSPPPDQETQDQRVKFDEEEIFNANQQADKTRRPETGLVYFAGLTEGNGEDYDSAEAEELEGLLAAQQLALQNRTPTPYPVLKIFIANGGSEMKDAVKVANMLLPLFDHATSLEPSVDMLGVVGMDRSVSAVADAIKILTAHKILVLATTLSADTFADLSPYYFSLAPPNMAEAQLILEYIRDAVPQYFRQPASKYYSAGSAVPRRITIYEPSPDPHDAYLTTLVHDLNASVPRVLGLKKLPVVSRYSQADLCGADTVDIYIGRHDLPLNAPARSLDDFGNFMTYINGCPKVNGKLISPFIIADDGVTRFVADPAARLAGTNGDEPVSYVTKGIALLRTGSECLGANAARTTDVSAYFCGAYAKIVKTLAKDLGANFKLYWTGERVGLAYDAAEVFLNAEDGLGNATPTSGQVLNELESQHEVYTGVTGAEQFTATDHTGIDKPGFMPLAIVRIDLSASNAMPTCEFPASNASNASNASHLGPGPNADKRPRPDICPVGAG